MCPSNLQGQVPPHSHIATGQGATAASEQIAQSVCKPLLLHPGPLLACHLGRCVPSWIQETAGFLLRKPPDTMSPMPGSTGRCWKTRQGYHTATTALAPVLLHCCFPKVVQIGNKGQLDMARTSTWVCFSAPSPPSAPLRREANRTGFIPQCLSPAMAQDNLPKKLLQSP